MSDDVNAGLQTWQMLSNHNRMIDLQNEEPSGTKEQSVEIAYFGGSAFRITSPLGITMMIDPWRNFPTRKWDWYFHDFPITKVDIGLSTHAHFDHDALHRLDAHVLLDRLIGTYGFRDVTIHGIAEKHAIDSSCCVYDFRKILETFQNQKIAPPNNQRSWDNCLIVVETGGLRILHWGDNRCELPESVWALLGRIDIALIPIDNSQHVIGHAAADTMLDRLKPKIVIPHHYYIWDIVQRSSTLQSAEPWVQERESNRNAVVRLDSATTRFTPESINGLDRQIHYFGDHVAFDRQAWHETGQ